MEGDTVRKLTEADVTFTLERLPEYAAIRGNAVVSGDAAFDKKVEDKILADLEFNEWAWCCVRVVAEWNGLTGDDYLGCCSYESEEQFCQHGGYYDDMKAQALGNLNSQTQALAEKMGALN